MKLYLNIGPQSVRLPRWLLVGLIRVMTYVSPYPMTWRVTALVPTEPPGGWRVFRERLEMSGWTVNDTMEDSQ